MSFECDEIRGAIPWLLDEELDPQQVHEVEGHLAKCGPCREVLKREGNLRLALRRVAAESCVSSDLRARISRTCGRERRRHQVIHRVWPAATAAAVLFSFIWQGATGTLSAQDLEEAAVRHARNLPMDVVAGDLDKVQRYFDGKLPFAVRVPQFVRDEPISVELGGRVINLRDQDAAYVRYELPRGRVSVFVYPEPTSAGSEVMPLYQVGNRRVIIRQVRGYTAAQWRSQGLVYSLVTDLPERELSTVLTAGMR
jgi:anti-sigma factor RsiW